MTDTWINLIKKMSNVFVEKSVAYTMNSFGFNYVEKLMIGIIPSIIIYNSIEDLIKKKLIGFNQYKKDFTVEEVKIAKFAVALNNIPFRFSEDVKSSLILPEIIESHFGAFYISFVDGTQCFLNTMYSINSLVLLPEYLSSYFSENDSKLINQKNSNIHNIQIEEKKENDNQYDNQQSDDNIECIANNNLVFNVH